jgi:hypothetical protein
MIYVSYNFLIISTPADVLVILGDLGGYPCLI